jgi:hypothetical protein
MNDIKLRIQHPLIRSTYINTFDRQDMMDEGDQTIKQHRSISSTLFPNKMSTIYFRQLCLR